MGGKISTSILKTGTRGWSTATSLTGGSSLIASPLGHDDHGCYSSHCPDPTNLRLGTAWGKWRLWLCCTASRTVICQYSYSCPAEHGSPQRATSNSCPDSSLLTWVEEMKRITMLPAAISHASHTPSPFRDPSFCFLPTSESVQPVMLIRPRLRSKRGCLTCRRRRKKCSEDRPKCRDCSRHDLRCTWPEDQSQSPAMFSSPTSSSEVDVNAATPQSQVLSLWASPSPSQEQLHRHAEGGSLKLCPSPPYRPLPTRSIKENALFQHFGGEFIPLLFRTTAHPGFLSVSDIYITAVNHPWMMDIFLGLAALHLSQGGSELQSIAHQYYYTAIGNLRQNIEGGCTQGTEDWLLVATIFLYLFEVSRPNQCPPRPSPFTNMWVLWVH